MSISTEISAALQEVESAIPQTFTWQSNSYACSASSFEHSKKLDAGGFDVEFNLTLTVRRSLFTGSIPAAKETIIHKTKTARIEKVVDDPSSTFLRLFCMSATK